MSRNRTATGFGWRVSFDMAGMPPVLAVWHPRHPTQFTAAMETGRAAVHLRADRGHHMSKGTPVMTTYIVAVHLIIETNANRNAEVGGILDAVLTESMRKYLGAHSALIDWAVAGPGMAPSIAPVDLSNIYTPDESRFPDWPTSRHLRQERLRAAMS